ncbi:MAG: elongation factor P [Atopostipes suicloacalis]|nr:elongation factor P [Atopostipes suicloacalis]
MISSNEFKRGQTILYKDSLWQIIEFEHVNPGRGQAFVRSKLKNLRTGANQEVTFRASEKLEPAHIDRNKMQYLYENDGMHIFMNVDNYEQVGVPKERMEDELDYLKDNMEVQLVSYEGEVISLELPPKVNLEVTATEPGIRGDTQSGGSKPATLETGAVITVPLFVNVGDVIEVSTEDGSYSSRV